MTEILNFLTEHFRTVLAVLIITVIAVVVFIVIVLRRSREKPDEKSKTVKAPEEMPAPIASMTQAADLELSFRRGMKTLRGVTSGAGYRYRIPWYMMLGPTGSGNSTFLRQIPLPRRVQGNADLSAASHTVGWHFFDGGVVLDVTGSVVLKKDLTSDERGWQRLLALLKRHRPERPIDGVVLTLSAADLRSWRGRSKEELREIGGALFRRLREAQAELGVRFPVYVLLTQADRLPGFSSFVNAVPRRFHQDIFGWSSPYSLEASFREEWVDEALDGIADSLRDRSTEVLASRTQLADADAVFRFPDVADELRWATRTILAEVFEDSAYHESFFLRGVYFSGMVEKGEQVEAEHPKNLAGEFDNQVLSEETAVSSDSAAMSNERIAQMDELLSDQLNEIMHRQDFKSVVEEHHEESVFSSRLFTQKIFPERGLARGFAKGFLDRNRAIRWIQVAAALLVLVGLPGMFFGQASLRRDAGPLIELLDSVGTSITEQFGEDQAGLSQAAEERAVRSLLEQMSSLEAGPFRSVFLPTSFFDDLDQHIQETMTEGFQDVILPTFRTGITEWADTMTDKQWAMTLGGRIPLDDSDQLVRMTNRFQEYEVLVGYLSEIGQFLENADRFNRLSGLGAGELQVFADLFFWYYETQLPQDFFENDEFYRAGLAGASVLPVGTADWAGFEVRATESATFLLERFYQRLLNAVEGLKQSFFAGASNPAFTASDLRQLWQDVGQVHDLLVSSDSMWFDTEAPLVPVLQVMLDSIPVNPDLMDRAAFQTLFTQAFDATRRRHLTELSNGLALLSRSLPVQADSTGRVAPSSGTRIDLAPRLGALRIALASLLNRGFMAPIGGVGGPPQPMLGGRPTWNMGPLEEALGYFAEYQAARGDTPTGVPPELRGLALGVAGRSLEERVRWSLSRAMTFEVSVGGEGRAWQEEELQARLAGFDQAARRLVGMLEMDEQVGGTPAGTAVAEAIILEASDLLSEIDMLLSSARLYEPVNGNLAVWRGTRPASLVGFGVPDAAGLEAYLAQQRQSLKMLAEYAAPVLGYLALPPVTELLRYDGRRIAPGTDNLIQRWRTIVRTLDEHENKAPGNELDAMEQFVRQDMGIATLSQCGSGGVTESGAPSQSYFGSVERQLRTSLADRCRDLARMALLGGYNQLAQFHGERLAGRFPFADLDTRPDAPDADVESVLEFLELWDQVTAPLDGDPITVVQTLLDDVVPVDFFRQMVEIRALLGPVVLPNEEGVPGALDVRTQMRTNRDSELRADQIVEWRLSLAGQAVTYQGAGGVGESTWRVGDVVALSLTWASESARRPVRQSASQAISVDDATVTWRYAGPWALLRLLMEHRPDAAALTGDPIVDRSTVNPRIVTRARDAVSETADPVDGLASVFIQLGLTPSTGGGTVIFPRFPTRPPPPAGR